MYIGCFRSSRDIQVGFFSFFVSCECIFYGHGENTCGKIYGIENCDKSDVKKKWTFNIFICFFFLYLTTEIVYESLKTLKIEMHFIRPYVHMCM